MIASISNWFTDQKIAMIAAGMACVGFIGPGLFDLPPPRYFEPQSIVVEHGGGAPDTSASSIIFSEPSSSVPKKMAEQPKSVEMPEPGLGADLDGEENVVSDRAKHDRNVPHNSCKFD